MSKHLKLSIVCFALAFLCLVGLAYSAFATNYYVNTASSGGDGTTTATSGAQAAFATVAAAQAALTGDQHGNFLLFNKGNTWREQFTVGAYGTGGYPFTIGAYGTGAAPIIAGSKLASASGDWTQEVGSVENIGTNPGFESNSFTGWTESDTHNYISVSTTQKHSGTYSAYYAPGASQDGSLKKSSLGDKTNSTLSWWVYGESTTNPDADIYIRTAATDNNYRLSFQYAAGNYNILLSSYNDSNSQTATSRYNIGAAGGWHQITVVQVTATVGGNNGSVQLLIDGVSKETISNIDNDARGIVGEIEFYAYTNGSAYYYDDFSLTTAGGDTNLWYTAVTAAPNVVWKNGTRMTVTTTKTDLATDTGTTKWYYDAANGRVYMYGGGAFPSGSFEIAQRNYCITATDKGYVTVDGLTCQYANADLIRLTRSASTLSHWTISNSTLRGVYGKIVNTVGSAVNQFDNFTFSGNTCTDWGGNASVNGDAVLLNYGDAFDFNSNIMTWTNTANNNYGGVFNIAHTGTSDTGSKVYYNTINGTNAGTLSIGVQFTNVYYAKVYLNAFSGNYSIGIWTDESGSSTNDGSFYCQFYLNYVSLSGANVTRGMLIETTFYDQIYYNLIDVRGGTGGPWGLWLGIDGGAPSYTTVYNNVILTAYGGITLQLGWTGYDRYLHNVTVKNNILYSEGDSGAVLSVQKVESSNNSHVFDYNNYYCSGTPAYFIGWFGSYYASAAALHAAQATQETHGLTGDPFFVSTVTPDFRLRSNSPCINAGVSVGLTTDYVGTSVPRGSAPDIGAYEFISGRLVGGVSAQKVGGVSYPEKVGGISQ